MAVGKKRTREGTDLKTDKKPQPNGQKKSKKEQPSKLVPNKPKSLKGKPVKRLQGVVPKISISYRKY